MFVVSYSPLHLFELVACHCRLSYHAYLREVGSDGSVLGGVELETAVAHEGAAPTHFLCIFLRSSRCWCCRVRWTRLLLLAVVRFQSCTMEADDEHVPRQKRLLPWLIRRRKISVPLVSPARAAFNRKQRRLIIDSNRATFKGHVFHVTIPLVRTGEANEQPLDLMDNIVRKETPAIPQTPPEHLPMLSDKKYETSPVKDVTDACLTSANLMKNLLTYFRYSGTIWFGCWMLDAYSPTFFCSSCGLTSSRLLLCRPAPDYFCKFALFTVNAVRVSSSRSIQFSCLRYPVHRTCLCFSGMYIQILLTMLSNKFKHY